MGRVLSFDIGIKNFAWVVYDPEGDLAGAIRGYSLLDLSGAGVKESVERIAHALQTEPLGVHLAEADAVLIEQQPFTHAKLFALQQALYAAVLMARPTLSPVIASPALRKKFLGLPATSTHAQRKKAAIELFQRSVDPASWRGEEAPGKLDDIADAFLLAAIKARRLSPPAALNSASV